MKIVSLSILFLLDCSPAAPLPSRPMQPSEFEPACAEVSANAMRLGCSEYGGELETLCLTTLREGGEFPVTCARRASTCIELGLCR